MSQLSSAARALLASFEEPTLRAAYQIALSEAIEATRRALGASSEAASLCERFADSLARSAPDEEVRKLASQGGAAADFHCAVAVVTREGLAALEEAITWLDARTAA